MGTRHGGGAVDTFAKGAMSTALEWLASRLVWEDTLAMLRDRRLAEQIERVPVEYRALVPHPQYQDGTTLAA